jgi:hypothetical protein
VEPRANVPIINGWRGPDSGVNAIHGPKPHKRHAPSIARGAIVVKSPATVETFDGTRVL